MSATTDLKFLQYFTRGTFVFGRVATVLAATVALLSHPASAQTRPAADQVLAATPLPVPVPVTGDLVVTAASCRAPFREGGSTDCRIGDTVLVKFQNLTEWIKADPVKHDPSNLIIALNNHPLNGTHANVLIANSNLMTFDMIVPEGSDPDAEANKQAWREILRKHHSPATMMISVGLRGTPTFYGPVKLSFRLYPWYTPIIFFGIGSLLLSIIWLAGKTNLIRSGAKPAGGQTPYSLGKAQMAWWFVLIVASYLYIWLLTENRDSLTPGVLILVGISAATGLGSQVAGASKAGAVATPQAVPDPAEASVPPISDASPSQISKGVLADILGDENGVCFDRLQMAAWTVVLGLVFIVEVVSDLNMPDFSPTLLGLMGISSGTYIGFKLPGKS